tara:strand:- start:23191 stop:24462 length:1272 start_codon:yes stop_codon:yes gene_type:complete
MSNNDDYAGKYKLVSVKLKNADGNEADIRLIIKEIQIHESINMTFALYSFHVIDAVMLLENLGVTGSEQITLEILLKDTDTLKTIELSVIDYGGYSRPNNQSQTYTITAINQTAMNASVKRISTGVNGSACGILQDLYREIDQKNPITLEDAADEGNFGGIIPNLTYRDAFAYLISKAQTTNNGMFFFYETIWNGQVINSFENMISSDIIGKYSLNDGAESGQDSDFNESIAYKIKSIQSDFGLSAFKTFKEGGATSKTHMIDISTKEYTEYFFDISKDDMPSFSKDYVVSDNYHIDLADTEGAYFVSNRNVKAYDGKFENFSQHTDTSLYKKRALLSNLYAMSHTIDITGSDSLSSGKTLEITLQQATDPTIVDVHHDEMLSGNYLITEVVHKFNDNGVYYATVTIKKDSFDRKLMMRGGIF